mmetsp:Transcript_22048/g.48708  ORF Transcript_22048/g.48708 Transcript_22048/m.48708 type:complete len:295 (-) Transcript_22048:177-1061(-)
MAERTRLLVAAGQRVVHQIPCHWSEERSSEVVAAAGSAEGAAEGAAEEGAPSAAPQEECSLGSLEWSVMVLDERMVDLEVTLLFRPREGEGDEEESPSTEVLAEKGSGRSFRGSFNPSEDPRFSAADGPILEAIIFEFDNSYSWLTAKELELITIRTRAQRGTGVPPLPQLEPLAHPPRPSSGTSAPWGLCPDLLGQVAQAPKEPEVRSEDEALRFVVQLDAWLAAADPCCPRQDGGPAYKELLTRFSELRGLCGAVLAESLPTTPVAPADSQEPHLGKSCAQEVDGDQGVAAA